MVYAGIITVVTAVLAVSCFLDLNAACILSDDFETDRRENRIILGIYATVDIALCTVLCGLWFLIQAVRT